MCFAGTVISQSIHIASLYTGLMMKLMLWKAYFIVLESSWWKLAWNERSLRYVNATYCIRGALNCRRSLTDHLIVGCSLVLFRWGGERCFTFKRRCGPGAAWLAWRAVVGIVDAKINFYVKISLINVDREGWTICMVAITIRAEGKQIHGGEVAKGAVKKPSFA